MAIKSLSIRIDTELLDKLHVVADYEGRSANGQINILIRDCVAAYEKEHGPSGWEHGRSKAVSAAARSLYSIVEIFTTPPEKYCGDIHNVGFGKIFL